MKLKFLGSADSAGIPVHNCKCRVCEDYRAKGIQNLATSAYLELEDNSVILLDAGIENITTIFDTKKIEAVFLTHFHGDHCLGLLRLRHSKDKIDCFHPFDKDGFSDLFKHKHSIDYKVLEAYSQTKIKDLCFTTIPLKHSKNTFGYLIHYKDKTIAYLTDCFGLDKKAMEYLQKFTIDLAFIDACYDERKKKGNHLNYYQANDILKKLSVKEAYLLHISHETKNYILENKINLKFEYLSK